MVTWENGQLHAGGGGKALASPGEAAARRGDGVVARAIEGAAAPGARPSFADSKGATERSAGQWATRGGADDERRREPPGASGTSSQKVPFTTKRQAIWEGEAEPKKEGGQMWRDAAESRTLSPDCADTETARARPDRMQQLPSPLPPSPLSLVKTC